MLMQSLLLLLFFFAFLMRAFFLWEVFGEGYPDKGKFLTDYLTNLVLYQTGLPLPAAINNHDLIPANK